MANLNLAELFMDTVYADIIFVVDKKEIPGHRLVLAKTCPYFDKLLYGDFSESKSKKVEINGASATVFKQVMRFVYKKQLEVDNWTIEDLVSLLAVAHEYQFVELFSAVVKALEEKPLNFDSWPLVNSSASLYDSEELRRKCSAFAEEKIHDFIRGKDLQTFSADFLCCMLDGEKIYQDNVLKAISKWKYGRSSSEITSVMQKISWEKVCPKFAFIVLRELLSTAQNVAEHEFWTKLAANFEKPSENKLVLKEKKVEEASKFIVKLDSIVLSKHKPLKFELANNRGILSCRLLSNCIELWFNRELPVRRLEFESETSFSNRWIYGKNSKGEAIYTVFSEPFFNIDGHKYNAAFSDIISVRSLYIHPDKLSYKNEITLKNFVIYP